MVFVVAGVKMAPRFWFYVACFLIAIKSAIALMNIYTLTHYLVNDGPIVRDERTGLVVLVVQILFLGFAALIVAKDRNIRKEPTAANPVLDF